LAVVRAPEASQGSDGIANRVRSGLVLSGGSDALRQAAEFVTGVVLARLLMPSDFGVVAVVSSILQLSFVVGNFGLGTTIIQTSDLTDADTHVAFTASTLVGLGLTLVIAALGPWSAGFFSMPLLELIVPIMSVQLLLSGIAAIPLGLLRRSLSFKSLAIIDVGSTICYAVTGISLALTGYGVWSLVWAPLASQIWSVVAACISSRYRPVLSMARASIEKLLGFSTGLTVKNVFVYVSRNLDNLIVAKMLGDSAAGLYTRGFNLTRVPQMRIVALIYRVCFPAFCKLRDDGPRLQHWYLATTILVSVLSTPILLGLAVVAEDFTIAVLGEQWAAMAPVIRILCFGALLNCFHMLGGAIIEATGKVRYEVYTQAVYAAGIVVGCIAAAPFGIEAVAYAVLIASAIFYAAKLVTVRIAIGISIGSCLGAALPSLAAGTLMYVVVYFLLHGPTTWLATSGHWTRLFAGTAVGTVVYPVALFLVARSHATLFFEQIKKLFGGLRHAPIESAPSTSQV